MNARHEYLRYGQALASHWPIATGCIEGACRHFTRDQTCKDLTRGFAISHTGSRLQSSASLPRKFYATLAGTLSEDDAGMSMSDGYVGCPGDGFSFEARLINAIQPVRGFALAQAIFHAFSSGLFDAIDSASMPVSALAEKLRMSRGRLEGFLLYLANENLICLASDGTTSLTPQARELKEFRPWYELLVGGYAETFQQIGSALLLDSQYASRNDTMVGIGSCGISKFDAIPLVEKLIESAVLHPVEIVDLACGDGSFLREIATKCPEARAIGIDPFAPESSVTGSVLFHRATASAYFKSQEGSDILPEGRLYIASFLLQEILEQEGRASVVALISKAIQNGNYLAVIEVDHRPADPEIMRNGLGLAYYNPYYLLHQITNQKLERIEYWKQVFVDSGAHVVTELTANNEVDSTNLEFGVLLCAE